MEPRYYFLIIAESGSMLGTMLSRFGLSLWMYERTQSFRIFVLMALFSTIPGILTSPLAGTLADALSRKQALLLANSIGFVPIAVLMFALHSGFFEVWLVLLVMAVSAMGDSLHWPTYSATIPMIVSEERLNRVNGMIQGLNGAATVIAPALGAAVLFSFNLEALVIVDGITFLFAIAAILAVRIPSTTQTGARPSLRPLSVLSDFRVSLAWIFDRRYLGKLLILFAAGNFFISFYIVALIPYYLSFMSIQTVGFVESVSALGLVSAGAIVALFNWPREQMRGVVFGWTAIGVFCILHGFSSFSLYIVAVLSFLGNFAAVVVNACSQTIWQLSVPSDIQGRIFAIRRAVAWVSGPIGMIAAVPVAEGLLAPMAAHLHSSAGTFRVIWDTQTTAAFGLLIVLCGSGIFAIASLVGFPLLRLSANCDDAAQATQDNLSTSDNLKT
ncbi:MFS transporter [Notoacmeibacter marinus]|uniref:MFS transporter n=1 Tax=Notoacmeibacter marinus TaxID=1876515 RepID=UPI000DF19BEE|nr:MFS transporter [Notoacmeibacter marinus]